MTTKEKITGLLAQDVSGAYQLLPANVLDLPGVLLDRASDVFILPSGEVYTLSTARYEYGGVGALETKWEARLEQVEEVLGSTNTSLSRADFEDYKQTTTEKLAGKAETTALNAKLDTETFEEYKKAQETALSLKQDKPPFVKGAPPYCTLTDWEAVELVSYGRRGSRVYDRYAQGYVLYGLLARNDGAAAGGGLVEQIIVKGCRILKP